MPCRSSVGATGVERAGGVRDVYGLTRVATDNLVASYTSRFQRDPDGNGYRFFAGDYGQGIACSAEQRDAYVTEFMQFVERRARFQIFWVIGLVVFTVAFLLAGTFWLEWQPLIDFMERDDNLFPIIGAVLTVLPLILAFRQGHRLYQKPVVELSRERVATGRRHSAREVLHRRVRGMSDMMIGLIIIVPLAGIIVNGLEINGGRRSVAVLGGYGVMFILGCVMAVWKRRGK